MASDSTTRFTDRVADYVRYRPNYPNAVRELLESECGLGPGRIVADVGSGTGISVGLLLPSGAQVIAVEPNSAMRAAAEARYASHPRFKTVNGTSEATGLEDASVDLVTAFQAFHWFDRGAAAAEFNRILRTPKWVALVWNERIESGSPFLEGYEAILREYAGDYLAVRHNAIGEDDLQSWFAGNMKVARFPNAQRFDYEGAKGRLLSSSYAPPVGDPRHEPMLETLHRLFEQTNVNGAVEFKYETQVFYGSLNGSRG